MFVSFSYLKGTSKSFLHSKNCSNRAIHFQAFFSVRILGLEIDELENEEDSLLVDPNIVNTFSIGVTFSNF